MAGECHGTYLVVRLGGTTRRAAGEAVKVIQDCGGRVLGCVVIVFTFRPLLRSSRVMYLPIYPNEPVTTFMKLIRAARCFV